MILLLYQFCEGSMNGCEAIAQKSSTNQVAVKKNMRDMNWKTLFLYTNFVIR